VKLPAHPVRTGQARLGFPKKKSRSYCAASCLPVGRDPAYPALAGPGYVPFKRNVVKGKYRILIAEDQAIVRECLRSLVSSNSEFEVVGEAGDGREAIRMTENLRPHLVLMDLSMPKTDGLVAIKEVKKRFPKTKILALTIYKDEELIMATLDLGVDGYALKDSTYAELMVAVKSVLSGKRYICPGISEKVIKGYLDGRKPLKTSSPWMTLTAREREILKLIAEGHKSGRIAEYLCISPKTVETHRFNLMKKLDIRTTAELVALASKKGMIGE
jgi:DNA-binding NarL/FixJ family response regulator